MKSMFGSPLFISVLLVTVVTIVNATSYGRLQDEHLPMIPYSFGYSTADGMSRSESGSGGVVQGSYSYTDANGDIRQVKYTADAHGFRPEGDITVDRKTAAAALALAALAPKAPAPHGAPAAAWAAPAPAAVQHTSWAPAPVAQIRSYNSWEKFSTSPIAAHAAPAPAAWATAASPIGLTSYQVDTPTHKIWVKY